MASDTLISDPDKYQKIGYARKIIKTQDGCLAGASGDCEYCLEFLEWANTDKTTKPPKCKDKGDGALLILPNKEIHYFYGRNYDILLQDYAAIGAGSSEALAAFYCGADAIKAVEAACDVNMACGGNIIWEQLNNIKI